MEMHSYKPTHLLIYNLIHLLTKITHTHTKSTLHTYSILGFELQAGPTSTLAHSAILSVQMLATYSLLSVYISAREKLISPFTVSAETQASLGD